MEDKTKKLIEYLRNVLNQFKDRQVMDYLPKLIRLSVIKLYDAGIISEDKYLKVMVDHMVIARDEYFKDYIIELLIIVIADIAHSGDNVYRQIYQDQYQNQYPKTQCYKNLRHQVKERDHYRCQNCGIGFDSFLMPILDMHHSHYNNLYCERLEDLITLCRDCHNTEHAN